MGNYAAISATSWQNGTVPVELLESAIGLERISRLHDHLLKEAIRRSPLQTLEDFKLLALLRRTGSGLSQADAADTLLVSKGATSIRIDRLAGSGFATREPGPNRRTTTVLITEAGVAACEEAQLHVAAAHQSLLSSLSSAQLRQMTAIAGVIEASLDDE